MEGPKRGMKRTTGFGSTWARVFGSTWAHYIDRQHSFYATTRDFFCACVQTEKTAMMVAAGGVSFAAIAFVVGTFGDPMPVSAHGCSVPPGQARSLLLARSLGGIAAFRRFAPFRRFEHGLITVCSVRIAPGSEGRGQACCSTKGCEIERTLPIVSRRV